MSTLSGLAMSSGRLKGILLSKFPLCLGELAVVVPGGRLLSWLVYTAFLFFGRMLACALSATVWLQRRLYLGRIVLPHLLL